MKKIFLLAILLLTLNSCNSKIDYTEENLIKDNDLKFISQNSRYLSGYHDYDNNIVEFDLKLLISNESYFKIVLEKANADNWEIVHNDNSVLILYKIIDKTPTIVRFSKADQFVSVKIE